LPPAAPPSGSSCTACDSIGLFVEILRVGAPMSLQPILNNLALATLTGFVGAMGAAQLARFGVAVRLEYLLYPLAFGLGAGVLAMVGTNIGAGNFARATRVAWTAAALAAGVTGCIGLFGVTLPGAWTGLFTKAPEIHALAADYLVIVGFAYPFLGLGLTLASAFQAAGRPLWPLLGITSRALVVAAGGIAVHLTGTGLKAVAVVAASGLMVYSASQAMAFRSGIGRTSRVRTSPGATKASEVGAPIYRSRDMSRTSPARSSAYPPAFPGARRSRATRFGCLAALRRMHENWRQRQALLELDDHLLHDIGVSREEAEHESHKPFWK
jgi:uncharacterized protein YjiS (DUF1127 family)